MKKAGALLVSACLSLLAGCLDSEQEFTLNPDGSGKVKIKATSVSKLTDLAFKVTPEESLKNSVIETLEKSKGVDAWTDVSAKLDADGKTIFTGTAYFKDISQLKLNILGTESDFPHLTVKKEADGGFSVEATPDKKGGEDAPAPDKKPTEDELKEMIKVERAKFRGMVRLMETMRHFESVQRFVRGYDDMMNKAISELGKV